MSPALGREGQDTNTGSGADGLASSKHSQHKDVKAGPAAPEVGDRAPSSTRLPFPNGRLTIVLFLRHCGCPFAEKTFRDLTAFSEKHKDIQCIAVSHSSEEATERWIPQVGGTWNVQVIVDQERRLYANWGLGMSSVWHALSPSVLWSAYQLGNVDGIWNSPAASGSRWQTSGAFAINRFGTICWAHVAASADDVPDLDEALGKLAGR